MAFVAPGDILCFDEGCVGLPLSNEPCHHMRSLIAEKDVPL